jgi:hypothetical protein
MIDLGFVRPGGTVRIPFSTFDKDTGASATMTDFAVADILVYKDGSTTERASTAGYTATTDFDAKTGKHVVVIDLADNTTAGFWANGSEYLVAIDAVTVDAVTTGGWAARFVIGYRNALMNTTIATVNSQTSFTLTAGPAEDDALNGRVCILHDVASAVQFSSCIISDYTGSTKTVTLAAAPTFTIAATDGFALTEQMALQPTVAGRTLDVSTGGEAGIDWANIGSPTTSVSLSGTSTSLTGGAIADAVLDEAMSGHITAGSLGAVLQPIRSAACQAGGSTTTVVLDASASATDDAYNYMILVGWVTADGTNKFSSIVSDYVGSTKTATLAHTVPYSADATYSYVLLPFGSVPGATAPTAVENAQAVLDRAMTTHTTEGTLGAFLNSMMLHVGNAQSGGASSIVLDATGSSATNDTYNYQGITIWAGTGAGQTRQFTDYVGASKTGTVNIAWVTQPDTTSKYVVHPIGLDAATVATIATGVWAATRAGNATAGTFGEYVFADMSRIATDATAATNAKSAFNGTGYAFTNCQVPEVVTVTGNVTGSVGSVVGDVGGDVVGSVASVLGDVAGAVVGTVASVTGAVGSVTGNVGGNVTGSVGSLAAQAKADVNAEVLDVLNTDTFAEPGQEAPGTTVSLAKKIGYLYKAWRNKVTQTSTEYALYNDDGTTVGHKATVSEDGTTATRGEVGTGA